MKHIFFIGLAAVCLVVLVSFGFIIEDANTRDSLYLLYLFILSVVFVEWFVFIRSEKRCRD